MPDAVPQATAAPKAIVRLADVCTLVGRAVNPAQTPDGVFLHYSLPAFDDARTPVVEHGKGILSNKVAFEPPVVLFSKLNPRIPRVWAIAGNEQSRGTRVCSTEFLPLRPDGERLEIHFLAYALKSPRVSGRLRRAAAAATKSRERLKPQDVLNISIPLPSLDAQRRIAATLDRQMELVERAAAGAVERQTLIDRLSDAALREAFHGMTPLCIDPIEAEAAPAGWRWRRLTTVARLESGHTPSRRHPEWWGGDIPWLALPDIRTLHGKIAIAPAEYTNEVGIANSSARVLPKDTVALSRTASVGFVTIMGRPMATSQDFVNWVCGPELEPWFLVYLLMASRNRLLSLASGAIHKTIYMPTVESFHVCIPSLEIQRMIVTKIREQLKAYERMRERAAEEIESIRAMPCVLLRQIFGEAA